MWIGILIAIAFIWAVSTYYYERYSPNGGLEVLASGGATFEAIFWAGVISMALWCFVIRESNIAAFGMVCLIVIATVLILMFTPALSAGRRHVAKRPPRRQSTNPQPCVSPHGKQ